MIRRILLAAGYLVGSFVLFDAAADEIARLLGELFADAVLSTDNVTEGS